MELKIKTEPVCNILVAIPAYIAIITIKAGSNAEDVWYPASLIVLILFISIQNIVK
jgi:hypothetical protein